LLFVIGGKNSHSGTVFYDLFLRNHSYNPFHRV